MEETNSKIIIIDDEPQIRKLLKMSLQAEAYKIYEAASGREGLMLAASVHPDLVIVDLGLPDMDGKEVVKKLRDWSSVPVIILTAREQEQEKLPPSTWERTIM